MGRFQEETQPLNPYNIEIMPEAQRGLEAISVANRRLIVDAIDDLATTPRPNNSKLLRKAENLRRLTIGDYRVI
jgi:mRNA-degrading endonuclease RelE of RelBE toxin-antitoxin system